MTCHPDNLVAAAMIIMFLVGCFTGWMIGLRDPFI